MLNIEVKPNSKKQKIEISNNSVKVSVKAPARDGKANREVEKLLSKHYKKRAQIIKGHKSKRKVVMLYELI